MAQTNYDIAIIGASLGGVAAALRAQALGAQVCLIEQSTWVGGQFTVQGVCKPDENTYVETVGSTASYREFRHRCRAFYRNNYKLSAVGAAMPLFHAGGPWNGAQPQFTVDPKTADAVLKQMLTDMPNVHLHLGQTVVDVAVAGDTLTSVTVRDTAGTTTTFAAAYFLDATDLGDLLPRMLHRDEWVVGAEAHSDTHEPSAPPAAQPHWMQPLTFCIALEHRPGGDHTIARPADYDAIKAEQRFALADGAIATMFAGDTSKTTMWNYRRYIDARNFEDPRFPYDLSMINTAGNDYQGASIPTGDANRDAAIVARARETALSYLYWLQTECPRDDGSGLGYPELRPNPDAFGTADGVAHTPYVRESRRILALERVVEQDISQAANPGPRARMVADTCGIGTYAFMDGHELRGAVPPMAGFWIDIFPVQIPAGALVPRRLRNLLAACKNAGTTHLTSALYRLHPLEWNIGEAAGALAAFSLANGVTPRDAVTQEHLLRGYQRLLVRAGVPLFWWTDVPFGHPLFESAQMAGATGTMTGDGNPEMRFFPAAPLDAAERLALTRELAVTLPDAPLSRGAAALWLDRHGVV